MSYEPCFVVWAMLVGMVLEVALIDVTPGRQDEFTSAYATARSILAETPGLLSLRMTRGIERPTRFVLLVEWESVRAHEENFRSTERFTAWREVIGPFFTGPPVVEHYVDVDLDVAAD